MAIDIEDDAILEGRLSSNPYIKIIRFNKLMGLELSSWIKKYAHDNGVDIEDEAIEVLKEMHGDTLLSLVMELDKLIAFVGERRDIHTKDVEGLVGKSLMGSTFDLARSIGQRDTAKALELAYELISTGKRVHEIIGLLCWHFRRLLKGRLLKAKGTANFYIMNALGINRSQSNQFFRQLEDFDVAKLRSKMEILLEADLDIKRSRLDPARALEFAIIRLCLD